MRRREVAVWIVCTLVVGLMGPAAQPALAANAGTKIQKGLLGRLQAGTLDSFVVEFGARADLSAAAATKGWSGRGRAVYRALTTTAERSQSSAKALIRVTPGAKAHSFWLTNVLVVRAGASASLARRLAGLASVARVRAEKTFPLVEPVERHAVVVATDEPPPWGVTKIGADDVWADGILGSGVVVANIDTGVDFTHEALVERYRGNLGGTFDHDYAWWDPTGICGDVPCDNAQHGTHTMGTMVGGDGPGPFTPDIGVAPGASWIAAKGCEDVFCTESSLLSSGEFMVAPTDLNGDNPDPTKRPDIVNNSWGGGPGDGFYLEVVQAWRAAGIIPVFAAGNAGPDCESGGSPGDYLESFSAGATDENDGIAEFSSRGPSSFGKVMPDVSAPGVDVVSSIPGDGYDSFSGTSMAAPHTAGALALVLSAELALLGDVAGSTDAVRSTALDIADDSCGGDADGDPNNVFGDGRIDAQAAVALVATGGTLAGDVTDAISSDPIPGARIEASSGGRTFSATTDDVGHFELFLGAGTYTVTASAFGYQSALATGVEIETDLTTTQNFFLAPLPRRDIAGTVTREEDGSPIEGAEVRALGTPVAPAKTDANGDYTLTLPIGDYTIRVSAGGCTSIEETEVTLTLAGLTHDVSLSAKLDDFGHGCRPVAFDWVDATSTTALFGDQTVGRLALPFSFPFYGESYEAVYITDNGYLTFEVPEFSDPTPIAIPSAGTPNAAIYALWQNLVIDGASAVRYDTVGVGPDRAFVVEYEQLKVGPRFGDLSTDAEPAVTGRVDVEVKLWEDGTIDILYGDNPVNPGDGRDAGIGIENADGTDALQFSFSEDLLSPNVAYRYEVVPSGVVGGTVTDLNDGLPIAGAVVTATPGGRTVSTGADGNYSLRLRPGTYSLAFSATNYVTHEEAGVVVADGGSPVVDAALAAPVAGVEPSEIDATVDFGGSSTSTITVSNTGTSDLNWELLEREGSRTPPDLPPVPLVVRDPVWASANVPAGVRTVRPAALPPGALETVIDDPDDDSLGNIEVTAVRGGSDNAEMSVAFDFDTETPMDQPVGYVFFDTDQDPETGYPPEEFAGLPGQDIGLDYFADLFSIHDPGNPVVLVWDSNFELVAEVPASIDGQTVSFAVPLAALGDDDGNVDIASVIGNFEVPLDWAPDEGHGTIRTFTDAPWLEVSPESGVIAPGGTTEVEVTLGGRDVPPGVYTGSLVLLSDAPKQPALEIDVTLTVNRPVGWGAASGAVWDAHTFEPVSGAVITVHATWEGGPLELSDTTDGDGMWSVIGPAGTWDADVSADGYLAEAAEVTIVADGTLEGQDVFVHADQPHATVRPGLLRFTLLRGRQDDRILRLGNIEGHRELTFSVGEVAVPPPGDGGGGGEPPPEPLSIPKDADPNAMDSRSAGHVSPGNAGLTSEGDVLAQWETGMSLPWGVGYRSSPDTVTLSDPIDLLDVEFTPVGDRIGEFGTPWVGEWAADLSWDAGRGLLWHLNVGGDNAIYGVDPADGSVVETVSGPGWTDISQRGLAFDQATDTFYVGGWNEGIVYHVAGLSWPEPGATLGSCSSDDPNISGLAWNPAFQKLWVATNSEFDDIWLIDPDTCETEGWVPHPEPGGNGAGLELDAVGNLWTVSQGSQTAYLIESGLPTFSDVPWLDVTPDSGVVVAGEETDITVSVDSTGMAPGTYDALVGVVTDDPELGVATVRVRLLVTKYERFVNVGGGPVSFPDGTSYVGDRRYAEGRFGWVGASTMRTTVHRIHGTPYGKAFKSQREGMGSYRFTVPDGRYRVRLEFAELAGLSEFERIMDVFGEGALRFNNLDVAGRVGRWRALSLTFDAQVNDGLLVVRFARALGRPPILNSIRVTWLQS